MIIEIKIKQTFFLWVLSKQNFYSDNAFFSPNHSIILLINKPFSKSLNLTLRCCIVTAYERDSLLLLMKRMAYFCKVCSNPRSFLATSGDKSPLRCFEQIPKAVRWTQARLTKPPFTCQAAIIPLPHAAG